MENVVRIGVDLAKQVLQIHAVDVAGRVIAARAIARGRFIEWCVQLPAGWVVLSRCALHAIGRYQMRSDDLRIQTHSSELTAPVVGTCGGLHSYHEQVHRLICRNRAKQEVSPGAATDGFTAIRKTNAIHAT